MTGRARAADVVLLLAQEADRTGDDRYRVTPATLRQWVRRGHITRGDGGYNLREIVAYLDRRDAKIPA
ncbi:hypothetical protein [Amycolatopsis rubida]|uniref:Uncharacterized protein n=1 Tax=Amycolatopsis rubida TaxID=112413 RepID=A0A1I5IHF1_9PSEU|nr:hypothetical protein [Amycolatopsis rubida]SFO60013.1 hypothetical protein SAMN05421854_102475 [Amycolatopsis rubida]